MAFCLWKVLLVNNLYNVHFSGSTLFVLFVTLLTKNNFDGFNHVLKLGRFICYVFAIYFLLSYHDIPSQYINSFFEYLVFDYGMYAVVSLLILSIRYPIVCFLIINFVFYEKSLYSSNLPFVITSTDWKIIAEIGVFIFIALSISSISSLYYVYSLQFKLKLQSYILVSILGVYLSSYFYSGIEKVLLESNPISWIVDNNMIDLVINAEFAGISQIILFPFKYQIYECIIKFEEIIEFIVLFGECSAIFVLLKRFTILPFFILMNLMHIIIFIVSGIFFWKWIIFNFFLLFFFHNYMGSFKCTRQFYLLHFSFMFFGSTVFSIPKLGWYDSPVMNNSFFVAIDKNGTRYNVPSNYFNDYSVTIAQQRFFDYTSLDFTENVGTFGTVRSLDSLTSLRKEYQDSNTSSFSERHFSLHPDLANFVKNHHSYMVSNDYNCVNLYPHHIFSNHYLYESFYNLNLNNIIEYEFIIDTVHSHYHNNIPSSRIIHRYKCSIPI